MKIITQTSLAWLMRQTTIVRYFVIALAVHVALLVLLASIKIVAIVPGIIADLTGAVPPPTDNSVPDDPFAAYREFEYNGPTTGTGGGLGGKGPGGVPTAGGTKASILSSEARGDQPDVVDVISGFSDAASAITRPSSTAGGVGLTSMTGLGDSAIASAGAKGPGGPWLGANRIGAMKSANLTKYGGSAATERAVMAALRWLKTHQNTDGSWNCAGSNQAGTGLGLLAFLGHGETTDSPEFGVTVQKAFEALVGSVRADGNACYGTNPFYTQGVVTFALAEGYAMTGSPALKEPLERATQFILRAQAVHRSNPAHQGGWRYQPGSQDSDVSVTGWQIMALKSAKNAGMEVPQAALDDATKYLWNMYGNPGFGYDNPGTAPAMTAVGCLCAQFLGHGDDERVQRALRYLQTLKVDWEDSRNLEVFYMWYYMANAMFQGGPNFWPTWNNKIREIMVKSQAPDGHWPVPPGTSWQRAELEQKPAYHTAMGALILEVYYRYSPMYQILEEQKKNKAAPAAAADASK